MGEAVGELAIVGEQEQAGAFDIKSANGVEAGFGEVDQVDGAFAAFGIVVGADHAAGLEEHDVAVRDVLADAPAVDRNVVLGGVDEGGELVDDVAVNCHLPREDELFACAA